MVLLISSSYSLQFKRGTEDDGSAAEGVVVGVGIDAVEDGVGVVTLVQKVVEFEAENEAFEFILCRCIEEGHVFVLIRGDLATYMVIVEREVENCNGKHMDGTAVGERSRDVFAISITRLRPTVTNIVAQFEPSDGRNGRIAMNVVVVGAHLDDIGIDSLLTVAETVVGINTELGKERWEVLRAGKGERGRAGTSIAKQSRTADVDAVDVL